METNASRPPYQKFFLELNSARLNATNEQIVNLFLDIAASRLSRNDVEEFFRRGLSL